MKSDKKHTNIHGLKRSFLIVLCVIAAICTVASNNIDYELNSGAIALFMNSWGLVNGLVVLVLTYVYFRVSLKFKCDKQNCICSLKNGSEDYRNVGQELARVEW